MTIAFFGASQFSLQYRINVANRIQRLAAHVDFLLMYYLWQLKCCQFEQVSCVWSSEVFVLMFCVSLIPGNGPN